MIFLSYLEHSAYKSSGYVMQCLMFEQVLVLQSFSLSWLLLYKAAILHPPFFFHGWPAGRCHLCFSEKGQVFKKTFLSALLSPKSTLVRSFLKGSHISGSYSFLCENIDTHCKKKKKRKLHSVCSVPGHTSEMDVLLNRREWKTCGERITKS